MMKLHLGLFSSSCSQYCKVKMGQTLTAAQLQDGYGIGLKAARKLLMVLLNILTGNSTWLVPVILKRLKEWMGNSCFKYGNLKCVILLNCQLVLIIFMLWIMSMVQTQWTWDCGPHFEELSHGTSPASAVKFLLTQEN